MIQRLATATLATLPMFLLGGCLTTGSDLSARVEQQERQIQGLQSQVGQVEQVLPGQAEMWAQMQTMRQELNAVNGKLDDLQLQATGGGPGGEFGQLRDQVNRLEAVVRQMASQLAINTDSLGGGPTSSAAPAYSNPNTGASSAPASGGAVDTATALYNAGIKSFDQRDYKSAVVSFKDFTSSFPKHKLAGNANFWAGESYFQMKDYARAALAYQEVIAKYPGNAKVQSAMLKQGIALYNAGKKPAAQERLQELIKTYPSSPEASRAKQFLASNK